MKHQFNLIAGACLAICSASSFAATALVCPTTVNSTASAETFVKNCAPEQTLFLGGASTLKGQIPTILNSDIFDTAAMTPVKVNDIGSVSGIAGNVIAYYGMSKAALTGGTAKRLLAIYNFNNGSAAGVSQLFIKPSVTDVPESDVVTVGPTKNVANALCAAAATSTDAAPVVACSSHAPTQSDLAISDVAGGELYAVYAKAAKAKFSTLTQTPLFLQSFGVTTSWPMYQALQTQNIADGLLSASCTAGDLTAACQPSIRSADYASLVTKAGSIKSLAALVPAAGVSSTLTLARRDNLSGSQASSNIFFANGQCGALVAGKNLGGALEVISIADAATYPGLNILSAVVSGDVKTAVASTTNYAIGVLNVGTAAAIGANKANFVKIDGVSPNYTAAGALDSRTPLARGDYPFAMTSFAMTVTKNVAKKALTDALIAGFKDSSLHQAGGVAYLDGANSAVQSKVVRPAGNNCSPLVKG